MHVPLLIALLIALFLSGRTDSSLVVGVRSVSGLNLSQVGAPNAMDSGRPLPVRRLSAFGNSGLKEKLRLVIRERGAWRDLWKVINEPRLFPAPLPEVDFSREMLVVVALGQRPSGGYGIVVDRAYERDQEIEIAVVSGSPGRNCMVTQALTQPVEIVVLPRTDRSVAFRESDKVHDCN